jgi:membrane associated rhomboid family serine protease
MRSAAVGHQCPECVSEGAKSVRRVRTAFFARPIGKPWVTYGLIAINVVVFVLQQAVPGLTERFFLWPGGVAIYDEYYRLLTSGFLHAGVAHILFNMVALYFTGPALEQALGHVRFAALYLLSLLGGSVLVYLLTGLRQPTLGASGAIFGLFGASFVLARVLRVDVRGIVGLIVINLLITFIAPGISWQGHVGGLLTGTAVAWLYTKAPQAKQTLVLTASAAGLLVLFAALLWWRTAAILSGLGLSSG